MNDPYECDAHVSYRRSQLLRDAETYRLARQPCTAGRLRRVGDQPYAARNVRAGWLLRMRLLIGLPAER